VPYAYKAARKKTTMNHYEITWAIDSHGPRCKFFENEIPKELAEISCLECLRQLIVDANIRIHNLEEALQYAESMLEEPNGS
jgi:hypothetical protein